MAITSQLRPAAALGKVWISNWSATGLLKPSAIKPAFATIEQNLAGSAFIERVTAGVDYIGVSAISLAEMVYLIEKGRIRPLR